MKYHFVSMNPCPENSFNSIITLEEVPAFLATLFGSGPKIRNFRGSCTVWYDVETGRRAGETGNVLHDFVVGSTLMEGFLVKIWDKERQAV